MESRSSRLDSWLIKTNPISIICIPIIISVLGSIPTEISIIQDNGWDNIEISWTKVICWGIGSVLFIIVSYQVIIKKKHVDSLQAKIEDLEKKATRCQQFETQNEIREGHAKSFLQELYYLLGLNETDRITAYLYESGQNKFYPVLRHSIHGAYDGIRRTHYPDNIGVIGALRTKNEIYVDNINSKKFKHYKLSPDQEDERTMPSVFFYGKWLRSKSSHAGIIIIESTIKKRIAESEIKELLNDNPNPNIPQKAAICQAMLASQFLTKPEEI